MGVKVEGENLPLRILGPLRAGTYEVDGSMSSQLITGLLISMPLLDEKSVLIAKELKSTPYIDMTLDIMAEFGVEVNSEAHSRFEIAGGQRYSGKDYTIESDWSGLAFPLIAGAVRITDVSTESLQADRAILEVLEMCGAQMTIGNNTIHILKSEMEAFEFDATDCPDLFPPLVILAARCEGITRIRGVHRLAYKESNRAEVLRDEFGKLGVQLVISGDEMIIVGFQQVNGGEVDAHGDHRIAMALTLAGMVAQQDVVIHGAEAVSKSYPDFYADIQDLRGRLSGPEELYSRHTSAHCLEDLAQHHK
jgi:3-phosphoshikimate 1-carboxyvinyltransferase